MNWLMLINKLFKKMTKEELLIEAQRKYPEGYKQTKYYYY